MVGDVELVRMRHRDALDWPGADVLDPADGSPEMVVLRQRLEEVSLPAKPEWRIVVGQPDADEVVDLSCFRYRAQPRDPSKRGSQPLHVAGELLGGGQECDVAPPPGVEGAVGVEQALEHGVAHFDRGNEVGARHVLVAGSRSAKAEPLQGRGHGMRVVLVGAEAASNEVVVGPGWIALEAAVRWQRFRYGFPHS